MQQMNKLWCEERLKKGFDKLPPKEVMEMAGYVYPHGKKWMVILLWKGEGYTCDTQIEAELLANQQMIMGLLLKMKKRIDIKLM